MFYGSMKMLVRQVLANFESMTINFIGSIFFEFHFHRFFCKGLLQQQHKFELDPATTSLQMHT